MFVLPADLPDRLTDYAPGRIVEVAPTAWPILEVRDRVGITSSIPRYALEVLATPTEIDPERVRWLVDGSSTRPLTNRHVHVVHHRARLHVVDGHHALAAHLAAGSDRIPVRLVTPRLVHDPVLEGHADTGGAA
ncbi:MAG: hypothetical protein EA387_08510 [Nitriliruptor sp.]|nr:MAG: hypothetical protein EA387_08510 [Nitriliruptor sp.]